MCQWLTRTEKLNFDNKTHVLLNLIQIRWRHLQSQIFLYRVDITKLVRPKCKTHNTYRPNRRQKLRAKASFKFYLRQQPKLRQNVFSNICFCVCRHASIVKLCTTTEHITHAKQQFGRHQSFCKSGRFAKDIYFRFAKVH